MTHRLRLALAAVALAAAGCAPDRPRSTGPDPGPAERAPSTPAQAQAPAAPPTEATPSVPVNPAERAMRYALEMVGVPYRFGGASPTGFDCSGLVRYSFARAGIDLPRDTREQRVVARGLGRQRALLPGDLLFFSRGKRALHVGIYVGEGRFVHAAYRGGTVRVEALAAPHWQRRFLEARRVGGALQTASLAS